MFLLWLCCVLVLGCLKLGLCGLFGLFWFWNSGSRGYVVFSACFGYGIREVEILWSFRPVLAMEFGKSGFCGRSSLFRLWNVANRKTMVFSPCLDYGFFQIKNLWPFHQVLALDFFKLRF
jgi:hypothetical protein